MKNSEKIDLLLREVQRLRDDVARIRRVEFVPYAPLHIPSAPVYPQWPQPQWYVGDSGTIDVTRFPSPYVHTDTAGGFNIMEVWEKTDEEMGGP